MSEGSISISPCSQYEGTAVECTTPRTGRASSFSGISRRSSRSYEAERAASVSAGQCMGCDKPTDARRDVSGSRFAC